MFDSMFTLRHWMRLVIAVAVTSLAVTGSAHAQSPRDSEESGGSAPSGPPGPPGPPPTPVRIDLVREERVQEHRRVTGDLRAIHRTQLATAEPGLVFEFDVIEGQPVRSGDVLARLDARRLEIQLRGIEASERVAQATLNERAAELEWRQNDLQTIQNLSQQQASNPKELTDAQSAVTVAEARLAQAERQLAVIQAERDLLRRRLDDTTIESPFDGVVVSRHTERGQWVDTGDPIVEVVATGAVDAWFNVPQSLAGPLARLDTIVLDVHIDALGRSIESDQVRLVPIVDPAARTLTVIARLINDEGMLAPGMSIATWMPSGAEGEHLTVSKDAVLTNAAGPYVYVVRGAPGEPGLAAPVPIDILFGLHDRVAIRAGGLAPGDRIIVEGNERLFPMTPVNPVNTPASSNNQQGPEPPQGSN